MPTGYRALFRARAIRATDERVYAPEHQAEWLAKLPEAGARFRAQTLFAELDVLRALRPQAKSAMIQEARRASRFGVVGSAIDPILRTGTRRAYPRW